MKIKPSVFLGAGALLLVLSDAAQAHPGHGSGGGFGAGFLHPVSGIDHILAMVAVGLWAAQVGGRAIWMLPATFVTLMVGGGLLNGLLSHNHMDLPLVEQGIMASVLVLGLMIAMAAKLPAWAMMAMVGAFAIFHGYAHVAEMNAGESPATYAAGFILATALLHVVGIALGLGMKRALSRRMVQTVGAAIACCGVLLIMGVL